MRERPLRAHPSCGAPSSEGIASHIELRGDPSRGLVVLCDHARNAIPASYDNLGLPRGELSRHIAYDIGVEGVARRLCERLNAPGVLACFSRLLIDPNRAEDDPTLIMRLSDGAIVPGNTGVSEAERFRRIELFYRPYHRAIARMVERAIAEGRPPAVFSIHSFTPMWKGVSRPWHAGVLWKEDPRFALPLIEELARDRDLVIGENEPYSGGLEGDTLDVHATRRGLAGGLIEIRQDLIADEKGMDEWADRLAAILPNVLERMRGA